MKQPTEAKLHRKQETELCVLWLHFKNKTKKDPVVLEKDIQDMELVKGIIKHSLLLWFHPEGLEPCPTHPVIIL